MFVMKKMLVLFLIIFVSGCTDDAKYDTVRGHSMEPTLTDGMQVLVDYDYYNDFNEVQRNDIVVLKMQRTDDFFVKRVIGVPGDVVETSGSVVVINSRRLEADLLAKQLRNYDNKVPMRSYILAGDGEESFDSKTYGVIPREYIIGKVVTRVK